MSPRTQQHSGPVSGLDLRYLVAFVAFVDCFVLSWSQLTTISAGSTHLCAVFGDGTLECWGDNGRGQLGQGYTSTKENSRKTVELPSGYQGGTWDDVQCGTSFTCAILLNGSNRKIFCWGANTYGQLGVGDNADRLNPTLLEISGYSYNAKFLRVGSAHACAVMDDSTGNGLYCWGYNSRGQLGQGDTANSNVMKNVLYGQSADKIAELSLLSADTFGANTCVLLDGRTCLRCWGDGRYGVNGDGLNDELAPRTDLCIFESELGTDSGRTISQLGTGRAHICALLDNGIIYCWGYGHFGMIGDGGYGWSYERVQAPKMAILPEGRHAISLAVGHVNTYAVLDDNSLWCWGSNDLGELGLGEEVIDPVTNTALYAYGANFITVPKKAEAFNSEGASVQIYAASVDYSCTFAVVQYPPGSLTVVGWGRNQFGQIIGDGNEKIFSPTNTFKCPTGTISNGVTSPCGEHLDSGSSCFPTCDSGYTLSGSRSCSAGTLTDTAVCNPDPCDASIAISNGASGPSCTATLADGATCTPTCNTGYTLSGARSCSSGTLTDTAVCNGNSCDASGAVGNGALNDCSSTLAHGAACTPTCNTGYTLSGTRSCTAGALTDTVVCNPDPCDASGAISNGVAGSGCTSTLAHGSSCTPTCNSGYTLSGTRSCSAGTLTNTAACNGNSCDASGAVANGALNDCTSTLAHGASCTPTCNTGYTRSGTRSCAAGTLTNTVVCNPDPCTPDENDDSKNGDDGIFYCINGGTVSGTTGSCLCTGCDPGFGGASCETAGACSASDNPDKDGSDGIFWCINGGVVGGTAGSCTCTCQDGWEGNSCEIAKACTASDDQAKDGSEGVLYCSEQHGGTIGGFTKECSCTCAQGWVGSGCQTADVCTASSLSTKDGSDGSIHCGEHGTVGGVTNSCTCTCDAGWDGSGCETAKACTASAESAKDGSDGELHCSAQYGTIGGTTGDCTCTCQSGYGGERL